MTQALQRDELRAFVAHRFRWLWRLLAKPGVRCALKWLGVAALTAYFAFVALILVLRYAVLPQVVGHQAEIEQAASRAIGMSVRIDRLAATWEGINPRLELNGVRLEDRNGQPALTFMRVGSVLSWHTLWRWRPILALLEIEGPVLHMRRDDAGRITIAGLAAEGEADPALADWLLEQRRIRVRDATIVWEDQKRRAPPLILEDLQFALDNRGSHHLFGLSAVPPPHLAARIDLRGDVIGDSLGEWEKLSGKLYAELDYADLAGWAHWLDYPVQLQQGRGALRVWGDWREGEGSATADLALEDVRIRLGKDLPQLDLTDMRGRVEGRLRKGGWHVSGQKVELSTRDGIRIPPTDFSAEWRAVGGLTNGSAQANYIDLDLLQRLAAYLPLDARSRELLSTHQPRGRVSELKTMWGLEGEQLRQYAIHARFRDLGMLASGYFPGADGLTGEVEANERGGRLVVESKVSSLDLPSVFPEPRLAFDELRGKATWKIDGKHIEAKLDKLEFASQDAAGSAQGSYRNDGEGPGVIDLTAGLSRASGPAVWRYMPHVVNADTRQWLKQGIVAGTASDARLTLKGDLRHFPFKDKKQGVFQITAKARNVIIDYARGWPQIEGVDADLSFGEGMRVEASQGRILGTRIMRAVAEIPSFEAAEEMLLVNGQVEGQTADFLSFIMRSPVADAINHMTDDMRATGAGKLALRLDVPLRRARDTHVQGEYQFANNQVQAVPGLPPVTQVNGKLAFTGNSVVAPDINGVVFGAPMHLAVKNEGEKVTVSMSGGLVAKELRKLIDTPLFDDLSGQTAWRGEIRVRKKTAEFAFESNLMGISSSLPEPFNKSAHDTWPLRVEKTAVAGLPARDGRERDQIRVVVRGLGEGVLLRRREGDGMQIERGALAVGGVLPALPARGVLAAVTLPRIDADLWRRALGRSGAASGVPVSGSVTLQVAVKTPQLHFFEREFNQVDLLAQVRDNGWQIALKAQEAEGELNWLNTGKGLLKANLKRLYLPAETSTGSAAGQTARPVASATAGPATVGAEKVVETGEGYPGLDIQIADLTLGGKKIGKLESRAHNERGIWLLDAFAVQNPDGSLKGKGQWQPQGAQRSQMDFELHANDVGKLLERFGYVNAVRRGTASLQGSLGWNGGLTTIHYPSLSGDMKLRAEKGQFAKLEPGIGKLLGLLSLQSLPRRLTLDFRDIFSEGLAFDTIDAKLAIKNGVVRTAEDLRIDGPSTRILMRGEADIKQETQDIVVTVQPEMGAVAAVGAAALAHPVIGAVALLANKVLQNPLNKIFAFQYHVTGSWVDPKVEKLGQATPTEEHGSSPAGASAPNAAPSRNEGR